MAIRMSGMVSGLDTESIIQSLMEVQTTRKTKVENNKTKLEWKQEKWNDLNSKIYKMYTGSLSNLRLESAFNTKKASSNNDSKVKVTADANAVNGSNTLKINELASSQYVTSGKLDEGTKKISALSKTAAANFALTPPMLPTFPKESIVPVPIICKSLVRFSPVKASYANNA